MYKYKAKVIRVIDGDTLDAMVDLGFNVWIKRRIRLSGLDAYETRTRDKAEKIKGLAAKLRVTKVLESGDNEILLVSLGVGKYGRCLGEVQLAKEYIKSEKYHGKSLNKMLVEEGHAKSRTE
jgi:micrococcal nuclease